MSTLILRLVLAVIGLISFVVLLTTANTLDNAWTLGGAVTLAVNGLYGLLKALGQP